MHSLRKWFYKPKKEDSSKLALFYWADEELTVVATELDSFDGRTDPDRCSVLVSQLRVCQDKVLSICNEIMDDAIPDIRANRDFRAKFPDDVLHENLAGQLWFGAECLAAGSNIIHRELESASMRPLAKALTRALDNVRCLLREQSLKNALSYSDKVKEALRIFDRLFAEFELCYVSAMVPIKSAKEYHLQQEIVVLFSETLIRALKMDLVQQDMIDDYDPSLMFTIPRLAIVWGLLLFPEGPFNVDRDPADLSELFRPFCSLLFKIRDLLWTLTRIELCTLEKMLCSQEEPKIDNKAADKEIPIHSSEDYISKFYQNNRNCKQFIQDFYAYNFGIVVSEDGSQELVNEEKDMSDLKDMETNVMNCRNDEELDVKLESVYESQVRGKTPEHLESDIETLVSGDFGASECNVSLPCLTRHAHNEGERVHIYSHSDNFLRTDRANVEDKHFEDTLSDNLRTNFDTSECLQQNRVPLSGCQSLAKCENCSFCSNIEQGVPAHTQDALSLERSLSRLHAKCTCNMDVTTSSERHAPSRELMRQVMRRVEIVPPGQQITGYSSSPEGSPRAYHHGLLSHSFPAHPGYEVAYGASGTPQHVPTATWCKRRHRLPRHPNLHNRSFRFDCDISPSRPYYNSHCTSPDGINSRSCRNSSSRLPSSPLLIPHVQRLRAQEELAPNSDATYSSCSSCQSISSVSSPEWDSTSPETSSYNSECQDDEEIALALQAAEIASRNKARSRFKSSNDLLHKLFVCISGVADQLQTNYASDLRNILKSVFDINCSQSQQNSIDDTKVSIAGSPSDDSPNEEETNNETVHIQENENLFENTGTPSEQEILLIDQINDPLPIADQREDDERDRSSVDSAEEAVPDSPPNSSLVISDVGRENENLRNERSVPADPPPWLPDELSSHCMACKVQFTILRRRHHCRNCGKIFCSRCSSNSIPLPRFGHLKPVRVCNQCFMYQLTSYVMQQQQS